MFRIVVPVTLSKFSMEAGMPTPHTSMTISFLIRNFRGLIQTNVFPRFTYRRTKKYRQATQLDKKVAHPAPAAPIPSPHGIMKIGSRIIFRKQPLIVPMLACRADPSERTRYAITTFKIAGAAPRKTVQKR